MLEFKYWRLFLQAPIDIQTLMSHRSNLSVSWLLKYCSRHSSKGSKYFLSIRYAPTANRTAHTSFGFLSITLQQKQLRKCKHKTPALHVIQKSRSKVDTHIWVVYSKVCEWKWTSKKHVLRQGWTTYVLKCTNHSRFNRECLHAHLKRKRINTSTTYSQLQGLQFVNRRVYDSIQWLGLKLNKLLTIFKAEESFREAN